MIFKKLCQLLKNLNRCRRFYSFQNDINKQTFIQHSQIATWAIAQVENSKVNDVGKSKILRNDLLAKFHKLYKCETGIKVLVHVPPAKESPGGYSVFSNLIDSLQYIGIPCERLDLSNNIRHQLNSFTPTIFLTSDSSRYLERIDWDAIKRYRINKKILVGLTASIEAYGNTPIAGRLKWAKKNGVDFYYSFRVPEYIRSRKDYLPFFANGYEIYSIEFGANPLLYYPVSEVKRDIPFVFLGSSNADKQARYMEWFGPLMTKFPGFINGQGWKGLSSAIPMDANKYLLARAQVGINLHLKEQIEWACELNERTYVLAACGVPQLVDNAKLLYDRFSANAFFIASNPKEYIDLFEYLICNPEVAAKKAEIALSEVYEKHTTLHRAESFVHRMKSLLQMESGGG